MLQRIAPNFDFRFGFYYQRVTYIHSSTLQKKYVASYKNAVANKKAYSEAPCEWSHVTYDS
jgi:hypothetical protein